MVLVIEDGDEKGTRFVEWEFWFWVWVWVKKEGEKEVLVFSEGGIGLGWEWKVEARKWVSDKEGWESWDEDNW